MRGGSHARWSYARWVTQGGLREVGLTRGGLHVRWVLREVSYAR